MVKDVKQLEKNVSASFAYVKKDLLMLNDAISDLHDKIQHLSINHAVLLEKLEAMSPKKAVKKVATKKNAAPKKATKKAAKKTTKKATKKAAPKKAMKKVVKETVTYA